MTREQFLKVILSLSESAQTLGKIWSSVTILSDTEQRLHDVIWRIG